MWMRLFQPLKIPSVALLWGGLSLSALGDQLYIVALTWIATAVMGAGAGYLSALQSLTVLLVVCLSGSWADRLDQFRCMLGSDLIRAATLFGLVILWLVLGSPPAVGLAATVVILAVGQALFQPALQSVMPVVVGDGRLLPAANGLFDGTERSARLLGPGLVALAAGTIPLVHMLTINAVSFLLSAAALAIIMRRHSLAVASRPTGASTGAGVGGILRGIGAMRRHPLLGYVLASAGPLNGAWYAVFFLGLPLLLREQEVQGLGTYGLLISAYGGGNLLSNVINGSLVMPARPQFRMFGSSLLVGAGMAAFALVGLLPQEGRLPAYLVAASVSGLAGPLKDIPVAVLRQSRIPRADIPAAVRAIMAANNMGILVAMIFAPVLLGSIPLAPFVFGCGAVAFSVGLLGLLLHWRWQEPA
jgi:hypothetical protein